MTDPEEAIAITSKTAVKINATILVALLSVACLAAFAWRDLELTVKGMSGDLKSLVVQLKEHTQVLQKHTFTLTERGPVIQDLRETVKDLRERLRRVESGK